MLRRRSLFHKKDAEVPILSFQTNSPNTITFDPTWVMASGDLKWDLGDTTILIGNDISHTYADGTTKTVNVYANTTGGDLGVEQINMTGDDIIGALDLSNFVNLQGVLDINANFLLTSLSLPISSQIFTELIVSFCNLSSLDLSGLTGLGGILRLNDNILLSSVNIPSSSQIFTEVNFNDCDLISLILSGLTGMGGFFNVADNTALSSLTLPTSSQIFTYFDISGTALESVDLSSLPGLGGSFNSEITFSLTSISLPITSQTFTDFNARFCRLGNIDFSPMANMTDVNNCDIQLQSNLMSQSEVDYNLDQIDQISAGGYTGRTFNIAGNNAVPSVSGLASKTSLEGKGFTVTVSI